MKNKVMTVNQVNLFIDEVTSYHKSKSNDPDKLREFSHRIVDFENTLILVGVDDVDDGTDDPEEMYEHLVDEPENVIIWLNNKAIEYFDWLRLLMTT